MFASQIKNFRGKLHSATFSQSLGSLFQRERTGVMAKIIEFKVPKDFRPSAKWVPPSRRGEVIEFYIPKKSA